MSREIVFNFFFFYTHHRKLTQITMVIEYKLNYKFTLPSFNTKQNDKIYVIIRKNCIKFIELDFLALL